MDHLRPGEDPAESHNLMRNPAESGSLYILEDILYKFDNDYLRLEYYKTI